MHRYPPPASRRVAPHVGFELAPDLAARRARHLYRRRVVLDGPQGAEVDIDGRRYLAFCSNDYLGLANHPAVIAALARGTQQYGVGAGASHLVSGHSRAHHQLEEELAAFIGAQRALLFSTGYQANLGVAGALLGRGDVLFEDRLNHASLIDAGILARATLKRYPHLAAARLAPLLAASSAPRRLIATDGVFSMDGDIAPLPALHALARRHDALLLVDDAHGLGVLGPDGRGTCAHHGLKLGDHLICMGTLGKALGTFGAFVAGDATLIETLIQHARTYIYTTALPPALAEATRASLALVRDEPWRRAQLRALVTRFRAGACALGFSLSETDTPIQPLVFGAAESALAAAAALEARGILVTAIRPPTVPAHTARLRITFSAAHTEAQVDRLLDALATLAPRT